MFHNSPVEGNQIVHYRHQGMGGAIEEAECNDPNVLLYGCSACHDLVDGRAEHMPCSIAEFSRKDSVLVIMEYGDSGYRRMAEDRIFFHQWPVWKDAVAEYPQLVDALRRRNEAEFDLAKSLAHFRPKKKAPELFRVCPEVKQMKKATFFTFLSLIGMTASDARELMPVGDWLNEADMDSVRGVSMDAIDALRKTPEEDVARLMGLTARLPLFWAEVDKLTAEKHGKRSHYLSHDPGTGELEDLGLLAVEPDVAEAFALIKGRIVKGGNN